MTRLALASLLSMLPFQAQAATVIKGTIDPVDGFGWITSDYPNPTYFIPSGSKTKVTLDIKSGVIAEAEVTSRWFFSFDEYTSGNPRLNIGNDYSGSEACSFNGGGPDGCFATDADGFSRSRFLTGLSVGQQALSFSLFRPADFDHCTDTSVGRCNSFWDVNADYGFKIAAQRPVSYTLTFSDAGAVPEPASWAMMIAGFGLIGGILRKKNYKSQWKLS
jgi:hypothetical protein